MGSTLLSEQQVEAFKKRIQTKLRSEYDNISVTLHSNGKIYITKPNSVDSPWDADELYSLLKTVDFNHKHSSYNLIRTEEDMIMGVDFFLERDDW